MCENSVMLLVFFWFSLFDGEELVNLVSKEMVNFFKLVEFRGSFFYLESLKNQWKFLLGDILAFFFTEHTCVTEYSLWSGCY